MPGEEAVPETDRSHPLLWAIVDFRETLDRLIEDQKELILSRGTESATSEPPPTPHVFAAPILDGIEVVTAADIQRLAGEVIRNEGLNFGLVGPFDDEARFLELLSV